MISLVIPIYNEISNIKTLHQGISSLSGSIGYSLEVIFIDDGSTDKSYQALKEITDNSPGYKIIKLSRNFGQQAAITAGIKYTSGDAVIILDADLQDPLEVIPEFIAKWKEGYEVVYGVRKKRKENLLKRNMYRLFYKLLSIISPIEIPIDSGDFGLVDRKVVDVMIKEMPESNRFHRGLRAYAGFNQIGLNYEWSKR